MSDALEMETPVERVVGYLMEELDRRVEEMTDFFRHIGEQCISIARVKVRAIPKDYTDRTGALRSSIGYAIYRDGVLLDEPTIVSATLGNSEGEGRARDYLSELQGEFPDGIVLVVVAGMDYAAYVQARGYDVLRSAELKMGELVDEMVAFVARWSD